MTETGLQDVFTLQIRRQANSGTSSPYCEACKNGFVHVNSLQVRQFTQSGKLPGVCKGCNEAFLKICRLQIRHLTHSESHPHVCPTCGKSFTHAGNIKKHLALHEKQDAEPVENGTYFKKEKKPEPPFECELCKKKFIKYGCFINHREKHVVSSTVNNNSDCNDVESATTDVPLETNEKESVSDPNQLKEAESVNIDTSKGFPCDRCHKSFSKYGFLLRHHQTHDSESFDCQVCKQVFKTRPLLSSHMRTHKNVCKLCKSTFAFAEELEVHLQNHLLEQTVSAPPEKVFNHYCSVCAKGFMHLGFLKNHFRSHSSNYVRGQHPAKPKPKKTPIHCEVCNRRFKFRRTLKKHMLVHKS